MHRVSITQHDQPAAERMLHLREEQKKMKNVILKALEEWGCSRTWKLGAGATAAEHGINGDADSTAQHVI